MVLNDLTSQTSYNESAMRAEGTESVRKLSKDIYFTHPDEFVLLDLLELVGIFQVGRGVQVVVLDRRLERRRVVVDCLKI